MPPTFETPRSTKGRQAWTARAGPGSVHLGGIIRAARARACSIVVSTIPTPSGHRRTSINASLGNPDRRSPARRDAGPMRPGAHQARTAPPPGARAAPPPGQSPHRGDPDHRKVAAGRAIAACYAAPDCALGALDFLSFSKIQIPLEVPRPGRGSSLTLQDERASLNALS
jgi:hypothetical protein